MLSAIAWLVYLYLIREARIDLYLLFNESFQWIFAGHEQPFVPEVSRFLGTLSLYAIMVVANGAALIAWAVNNQVWFGGRPRRSDAKTVGVEDLAGLYGVPAEDRAKWPLGRVLTMQHDPDGTLIAATSADTAKPNVRDEDCLIRRKSGRRRSSLCSSLAAGL
jgi:poly-beta-1,6-N-acetyl-D-glucosamine biosynthesis protein PgaD